MLRELGVIYLRNVAKLSAICSNPVDGCLSLLDITVLVISLKLGILFHNHHQHVAKVLHIYNTVAVDRWESDEGRKSWKIIVEMCGTLSTMSISTATRYWGFAIPVITKETIHWALAVNISR